jgi:hypothetical protein
MLSTHLAAVVIGAAAAVSSTYWVMDGRHAIELKTISDKQTKKDNDHAELHRTQERDLYVLEQKRSRNVLDAVAASRARETQLRAESARNRDNLVGLRESSANALSFARTSLDACTIAATTYDQLFTASTAAYTDLAEQAQRHVIDIETLEQAWPKE